MTQPALCETDPQALLEKATYDDYERRLAEKQTAVDRLAEDLKKGRAQADAMQKTIDTLSAAITEGSGHLDEAAAQQKHQPKVMEVISLNVGGERLKVEGLKLLAAAQAKALDALEKRTVETDLRSILAATEVKDFAQKSQSKPAGFEIEESGPRTSLKEQRKPLEKAERAADAADTLARAAMQAAATKLQQADAAAKAEKERPELGVDKIPAAPAEKREVEPSPESAPKKPRSKR